MDTTGKLWSYGQMTPYMEAPLVCLNTQDVRCHDLFTISDVCLCIEYHEMLFVCKCTESFSLSKDNHKSSYKENNNNV